MKSYSAYKAAPLEQTSADVHLMMIKTSFKRRRHRPSHKHNTPPSKALMNKASHFAKTDGNVGGGQSRAEPCVRSSLLLTSLQYIVQWGDTFWLDDRGPPGDEAHHVGGQTWSRPRVTEHPSCLWEGWDEGMGVGWGRCDCLEGCQPWWQMETLSKVHVRRHTGGTGRGQVGCQVSL